MNERKKLIRLILGFFVALIISACNKTESQAESQSGKHQKALKYASSISMMNGVYKVDTNIILSNRNKKELVSLLISENLTEKNTVGEIPDFIKSFLLYVSKEKEFSMANPGEKYQVGWFDLGKGTPTKQLLYFGAGKNIALLSYYSGGIRRHQNVIILKFDGSKIADFWFDNYDVDARTKEEMIEYLKDSRTRKGNC